MLGRFYDTLASSGALDHSWLIITADHGEELWEHGGFLHGHSLYDELLRVPLVVVPPRAQSTARRAIRIDKPQNMLNVADVFLTLPFAEKLQLLQNHTFRRSDPALPALPLHAPPVRC